jgi:hypothetical protein
MRFSDWFTTLPALRTQSSDLDPILRSNSPDIQPLPESYNQQRSDNYPYNNVDNYSSYSGLA